MALASSPDIG